MEHLTFEQLLEMVGGGDDTFTFHHQYEIHHFPVAIPLLPTRVVGLYRYRLDDIPTPFTQPFFMTQRNSVNGTPTFQEEAVIIRLGEVLEQRYQYLCCKVLDIQLPTSQGFSGKRHAYRQTRELFPNLQ